MPSISASSLGRTGLVGGDAGQRFNDLEKMLKNGQLNLDEQNPIKQIQLRTGWVVDGMQITYKGADGTTVKCLHGSKTEGVGQSFDLSDSEVVISVFGRAGHQDYYKRKMINSIGFAIFDCKTCQTRTIGPLGNGNNSNNGEPFYTGPVASFGGYAQDSPDRELNLSSVSLGEISIVADERSIVGLSGLWFYERAGGSLNLYPVQIPEVLRTGTFNSSEVRNWQDATPDSKKTITLEPAHASGPRPLIVYGLNYLDVDKSANIRARAVVEQNAATVNKSFEANIQSWSDTKLYSGGLGWLDVPVGRGIQGGVVPQQWTIRQASSEPFVLSNVRFEKQYAKPPTVLVWLAGIDMDKAVNWRLKAYATEVTESGFNLNVQTWADSKLYGASAAWLAVPSDDADIVVGKFSGNTSSQTGQASFGRALSGTPRVVVALCGVDFEKGRNLRVNTEVENVTKDGLKWKMSTWSDSTMHWAEAAFIAIAGQ